MRHPWCSHWSTVSFLKLGFHSKEGHAHVGIRAADGAGFFEHHYGAAAGGIQGLWCLSSGAEAGHTAANEDDIGFHMFHRYILLSFSIVLLL